MSTYTNENKTTLHRLKRGDLIEFNRGVYSHWAVYVGNEEVVHLAGEGNDGLDGNFKPEHLFTISGKTFNKACVCVDNFWDVVQDSTTRINNSYDKKKTPYQREQIVKNALSKLGRVGYSLITQNCEHFAKWCRYGIEQSDQVESFMTGAAVTVATMATAGLIWAVSTFGRARPQKEDEDDDEDST